MSSTFTVTAEDVSRAQAGSGTVRPLLEVNDLRVQFVQRGRLVSAVRGLTYTMLPGKSLAIIGESGSGKTVSSRAIVGLLPRTAQVAGSVRFDGTELIGMPERKMRRYRGPGFAMVFQDPMRSLNPTMQIGAQITEAIRLHSKVTRAEAKNQALELLEKVRISSPGQRFLEYPHQLSGGMRQRVMIAIALACHPKLLIADEATTALDVTTQAQIMELLRDLQRELDMALILISHDLRLAGSFTDEIVVMYAGRVVEQAPTRQLFANVRMPYTKVLFDAVPRLDRPSHSVLPVVSGRSPNPSMVIRGCAFHSRCAFVQDDCMTTEPVLHEDNPDHWLACHHPVEPTGVVQ
jgi:oligopeptide/dipeptide ABC transporter ATP-binding protein